MSLELALATPDRFEEYLRLVELFYKESPFYPSVQYNPDRVKQIYDLAMTSQHSQSLVLLLLDADKCIGLLVGYPTTTPFSDDLIASELAWYVEPSHRGSRKAMDLVYAYEAWAQRIGCKHVSMSLLTTLTDVSTLYERLGYKKTEISYIKEL